MQAEGGAVRLVLEGVSVGYGAGRRRKEVLAGVGAEVASGELVCLVGANGAGKSTLLRTLAGLQPVLAGRIVLDGRELGGLRITERARMVATVLTDAVDPGVLTVAEVVALGRHPYTGVTGRLRGNDQRAIIEALEIVGAQDLANRRFAELSDGQRQRALIARALAQEPKLLLLDEPTAFLDPPGRLQVFELVARLAEGQRLGVVVCTHDVEVAARHADRLWVATEGRVVEGLPDDLARNGTLEAAFGGTYRLDPETLLFHPRRRPHSPTASPAPS